MIVPALVHIPRVPIASVLFLVQDPTQGDTFVSLSHLFSLLYPEHSTTFLCSSCCWHWEAARPAAVGKASPPRSPIPGLMFPHAQILLTWPSLPRENSPPKRVRATQVGPQDRLTRPPPPRPSPRQAVCPGHRCGQHGPQGHWPALHRGQGEGAAGLQVSGPTPRLAPGEAAGVHADPPTSLTGGS